MAELFLVRHGQASFGSDNYDCLSALGERQCEWLGEYFAGRGIEFDRVLTGSMQRHEQTLAAIFRGLGRRLPCEVHPGLNEYDFKALYRALGDEHHELRALASGNMADYYRGLKEVLRLWSEDRIAGPLPETWAQFQQRVAAVGVAIRQGSGRRLLAVSSGGPIGVMTQQILQAPAATAIALNMQVRNSSISHYFFNSASIQLASFNSLPHLDPTRLDSITFG
jgi:broad specificity phosphatase PhoE